jgi:hypothetical protein
MNPISREGAAVERGEVASAQNARRSQSGVAATKSSSFSSSSSSSIWRSTGVGHRASKIASRSCYTQGQNCFEDEDDDEGRERKNPREIHRFIRVVAQRTRRERIKIRRLHRFRRFRFEVRQSQSVADRSTDVVPFALPRSVSNSKSV